MWHVSLTIVILLYSHVVTAQLFQAVHGKNTKDSLQKIWSCVESGKVDLTSPSQCANEMEESAYDSCQRLRDSCSVHVPRTPHDDNTDQHNSGSGTFLGCDSGDRNCRFFSFTWTSNLVREELVNTCPPDEFTSYTYLKQSVDSTIMCWDPNDLASRDTCPTGADYNILPVGNNNASLDYVCQELSDGSSCKYIPDGTGEFFENDPEGTQCYSGSGELYIDDFADPIGDTGECSDIGNNVIACKENPENVCTNGQCHTGCGTMALDGSDPVFVCFSGDTDGDGLPDYIDPDIDGDGIANEDDLDADGDGKDDPKNPTDNGNNVTVNVNTSEIERLIGVTNSKLEEIKDTFNIDEVTPGEFESESDVQLQINEATAELETITGQIQSEFNSLFSTPDVTGEFAGCHDIASFKGSVKQTCIDGLSNEMHIISIGMLFIFAFISIVILVK